MVISCSDHLKTGNLALLRLERPFDDRNAVLSLKSSAELRAVSDRIASDTLLFIIPGPRIFPKNNGEKSVKSVKKIFLHR